MADAQQSIASVERARGSRVMWLLGVIVIVALLAIGASALGQVWGPLLAGLGFAGWGVLILLSGAIWPWSGLGLLYLGGSVVELHAATEFWSWHGTRRGPPLGWRAWAALVGVAGSLLLLFMLLLIAASIAGSFSCGC